MDEIAAPYDKTVAVVIWTDSSLQNAQVHVSEAPVPEVIVSVGWLVKETDEYIVLARDAHKGEEWRGLCAIPRIAISSFRNGDPTVILEPPT